MGARELGPLGNKACDWVINQLDTRFGSKLPKGVHDCIVVAARDACHNAASHEPFRRMNWFTDKAKKWAHKAHDWLTTKGKYADGGDQPAPTEEPAPTEDAPASRRLNIFTSAYNAASNLAHRVGGALA